MSFLITEAGRAAVLFFHRLSDDLILNLPTQAETALCETGNIPIIKKYYLFVFFFFRKINSMDSRKMNKSFSFNNQPQKM